MSKRLGYGQLEEEILKRFHPYPDLPEDTTAEQFWNTPPLHERTINPVRLSKALDKLMAADKELMKTRQAEPKVSIKRADLEKFMEETGMRATQAEEYFVLGNGNVEEALLIWVNQEPGQKPKRLSEYEHVIRSQPRSV